MNIKGKKSKNLQLFYYKHRYGLLLCSRIQSGFMKGVAVERIKSHADWFFENYICPQFEIETKHIFPILDNNYFGVKKVISQYRRLNRLFKNKYVNNTSRSLNLIEEELERHIRFEEQVLFQEIHNVATGLQLKKNQNLYTDEKFKDDFKDEFWQ